VIKYKKHGSSILFNQDAFFIPIILLMLMFFCTECEVNAQSTLFQQNSNKYLLHEKFSSDSVIKKDTAGIKDIGKFKMTKSPLKAVLFSAVLPGAGQFYNKSYWKIPIIWGIGGYFAFEVVRNNTYYLDYRDRYVDSQTPSNPSGDSRLKTLREFYRDQRDQFIFYFGVLYLINLVDAYVDAHLFDFDVSDRIKLGMIEKGKLVNLKIGL